MCDFLSIIVRADGKIGHIPENSHSGTVNALNWRENDDPHRPEKRFVECEWNLEGDYPGAEKVTRGEISEKQRKSIDLFYGNAKKLIANPKAHAGRMLFGKGYFAGDEFADIRWRVMHSAGCPKGIIARLAAMKLYANGESIKSLHPSISELSGKFSIESGYSITAPALTKVTGSVYVQQGATFTAPALTVTGSVYVRQGATFTAPALTKVTGSVDMQQGATFTAPALTKVTGSVDMQQGATFTAPKLQRNTK